MRYTRALMTLNAVKPVPATFSKSLDSLESPSPKHNPNQSLIPRLPPLPSVRDLVKLYKLKAIKQLSQNFLLDEKLAGKIVKAAGNLENGYYCEVGPGPGGITRSIICKRPKKIVLIEKDRRFESALKLLKHTCAPGVVDLYWGDVLSFDMSKMFPEEIAMPWDDHVPPVHVIGNLPFSVSTPLIIKWLSAMSVQRNVWRYGRVPLTLTFQLEVAERLIANPLDAQRSRLSIMAQHLCHCAHKFTIQGSAFVPKPDVNVGVVKFVPRKEPLIRQEFSLVEKVVRQTFSMRRKYCRRGVSTLFPEMVRGWFTQEMFKKSNINPETRPYELTNEDFSCLCNAYAEICKEHPSLRNYNYRGFRPDEEWETMHAHSFESFRTEKTPTPDSNLPDADDSEISDVEEDGY